MNPGCGEGESSIAHNIAVAQSYALLSYRMNKVVDTVALSFAIEQENLQMRASTSRFKRILLQHL